MTPTLYVLRVTRHGADYLSLHTRREQAEARLVEVGRKLWRARFDYDLGDLTAEQLAEVLVREGWRVILDEQAVEL